MANQVSAVSQHSGVQVNQTESVSKSELLQLQRERELELIIAAKAGDEVAKADLLEMHTDFIFNRVRKHAGKHFFQGDKMDLYQEGAIAFMRAVELYDPNKGVLFTTYAYDWVTQAVDRYVIKNDGSIKLPVQRYRQLAAALSMKHDGHSEGDIAQELDVSENTLVQILQAKAPVSSLEGDVSSENEVKLGDVITNDVENTEDVALTNELVGLLYEWVDHLEGDMQKVIHLRYGLNGQVNKTYKEIADILNDYNIAAGIDRRWNKEGVRQHELKAIKKMTFMSKQHSSPKQPESNSSYLGAVGMFAQPVNVTTSCSESVSNTPKAAPAA